MTHNKDGSFDFDPNADYVAEVRSEQGEGVKESVGGVAELFDSAQFEADTLQKVADANESIAPTSEDEAEITQIEQNLHGVDGPFSQTELLARKVGAEMQAYSSEHKQEIAEANRAYLLKRNFWGEDHPSTQEAISQLKKVVMPRGNKQKN